VLIDGFTIFAQVINFLLLVWLLKRFFYRPVVRAMEEREKRIAKAMEQSELAEKQARQHADALAAEHRAFSAGKTALMAAAQAEIEKWREEKIENLRTEVEQIRQSWFDKVYHEREAFLMELKSQAVRSVMQISGKAVRDLADQRLESQIVMVFMNQMETAKENFQGKNYPGPVRLISGFELSDQTKQIILEKLARWFPSSGNIGFEIAPHLGLGIEVLASDKKVAWNLEKYLTDLEKQMLLRLALKHRNAS
jgi:F-type H+-transporting ATPase subunit b